MRPLRRAFVAPLVVIAVVASLGVRAGVASAPPQAPEELVVALSLPAPGLQVGAVRGGDVVLARGLEVELARKIARRLGRTTVRFVNRTRAALLASGPKRWDIAVAQITPTRPTTRSVDLSPPYLSGGQALLLRRGVPSPTSMGNIAELQLCARNGAPGAAAALDDLRTSTRPLKVPDDEALLRLVQTGRCDAALIDAARLGPLLDGRRERFSPVRLRIGEQGYVVALPKGSELGPDVDRVVRRLVSSGAMHRLATTWLGLDPARLRRLDSGPTSRSVVDFPQ